MPLRSNATLLPRGLGWFSLALGAAQLGAPDRVARLIGLHPTSASRSLIRAVGAREVVAGLGLLTRGDPRAFVWARVAGDTMDLALLANAVRSDNETDRVRYATAAVAGVTALDVVAAIRRGRRGTLTEEEPVEASSAITVNASPETVYSAWRDLERLPAFMYHLESVSVLDGRRSHWVAKAPAGKTLEWDAEITEDVPGERIAWRSLEGSSVESSGSVRFRLAPRGQGTEVSVELRYSPPGGAVGSLVAKLFGEEPNQQVRDDLRRFKQIVETGEVARSDGSPLGTRTKNVLHQRDAHPEEDGGARRASAEEVRA